MPNEPLAIPKNKLQELFVLFNKIKQSQKSNETLGNTIPTVIIIGAGMSGVTAASQLASCGFKVILLEARDRIGGRIHSMQLEYGAYVELGAQFLHGIKDNPIFPIGGKYHLEVKPFARSECGIYDVDGNKIANKDFLNIVSEYKRSLGSLVQRRQSDSKDRFLARDLKDFSDQLDEQKRVKSPLSPLAKKISLDDLHDEALFAYKLALGKQEGESNYLVTNGFANMLKEMLKEAQKNWDINIHLSTIVDKINHESNQIKVTSKNGKEFTADALICTLPLGVLKRGDVRFSPELPQRKRAAIGNLSCAFHNKVILEYPECFWENYSHFLIPYDPETKGWLDIVNLQYFLEGEAPILISSIHDSFQHDQGSEKKLIKHITSFMEKISNGGGIPLKNAWVTNWEEDPFSLGSYTYHPEGSSLDDNSEIARPIGRLIFAGEHTNRCPSNVQGAYLSGLEAAKQVIEQLYLIYESTKY